MAVNSIVLQNPFGDDNDGNIISGDILGRIGFSAPSETGADALLVTALISAVAEEPFTASANKTKILFSTANGDAATARLAITGDGHLVPAADDTYDLGTASLEFRNGYFDGTLEADAITLGGTALGSLYSPIAGSSSILTVGTIGTGIWQGTAIAGGYIANDAIDSDHYAAGSIDLEHMSSESVDEDNLHISNAGSNGQFLSKQSGNDGGLTWATPTDTDTTYSTATTSTLGLMKIEDNTEQSVAANSVSATAGRTYGVQFNSSSQAVVNVPWTDTDTETT